MSSGSPSTPPSGANNAWQRALSTLKGTAKGVLKGMARLPRQLNYFEVEGDHFVRVFAKLVNLLPHDLFVKSPNGNVFHYSSAYDLRQLLDGSILWAYAWGKPGEEQHLYQMEDTPKFSEDLATNIFPALSKDDLNKLIFSHPRVAKKQAERNRLEDTLLQACERVLDQARGKAALRAAVRRLGANVPGDAGSTGGDGSAKNVRLGRQNRDRVPVLPRNPPGNPPAPQPQGAGGAAPERRPKKKGGKGLGNVRPHFEGSN